MVWKSEDDRLYYLEQRKDPQFVAKKKKYLNEWYKKNRKKQLAYRKQERLRYPEKVRERRKRVYQKHKALLRSKGLSVNGKPLRTPEEMLVYLRVQGRKAAMRLPKKTRIRNARKARRVQLKKRSDHLKKVSEKLGVKNIVRYRKILA